MQEIGYAARFHASDRRSSCTRGSHAAGALHADTAQAMPDAAASALDSTFGSDAERAIAEDWPMRFARPLQMQGTNRRRRLLPEKTPTSVFIQL